MRFRSLHHHTTYSFLDGYGLPESHVRRAGELEMPSIACTDHGNISGHVQLEMAAKAEGVKPIFGVEAYTGHVDESKTKRKNHLTVLASDAQGYRNLLGLVSRSWRDFYYAPTTGPQNLLDHRDGLIILSGCQGSLLSTSLVGGKNIDPNEASFDRGLRVAERFRETFGDAYYLEVQAFPELETTCRINGFLEQISRRLNIPLVATKDVHYTKPSESELQKILHNTRGMNRQTLEQQAQSWGEKAYEVKLCPPISDKKIYQELRATGLSKQAAIDAILNTEEVSERCNVELPKMGALEFPIPQGFKTSHEVWLAWLKDGWEYRGIDAKPNRREYIARLRREMEVIEGKDFLDYFLFVSDVVKFAKDRGIPVGPARGSAAASLVCYLLRITEVDPVFFSNLVFERFIDVTRKDLPDIDLDFDDERREEVRQYLIATYGVEYVGQIGTFIRYKSKNSLDDVARAHGIPLAALDPIKDVLIERSSGDLRASATIEDTMEQFDQAKEVFERYPVLRHAFALEGNVRGMGVHAAGYIVSSKPLASVCAIYTRIDPDTGEVKTDEYGNQMQVISMDKIDAEAMNLLKIDALGLHTMALIRIALELIGMNLEDLYSLPLDDGDTLRGFQENDVVGIFQFDGRAMRSVNEEVRPSTFLEVCDVGALARPGPLHSGASVDYVDVKRGKERRSYHKLLDNIVAYTNGQIIYQEQILRIVMEIGKFDWTDAGYIRKIISKKLGDQEFNRQWEKFREGATSQGVPEDVAKEIWQRCITAGSYAFNNAHTVSYGMIGYWTMWLKRHHPLAFYTAALRKCPDSKTGRVRRLSLLRDAMAHGVEVVPPKLSNSGATWNIIDGKVQAGFSQIPGIGDKTAEAIVYARDWEFEGQIKTWSDFLGKKMGIGKVKAEKFEAFCEAEDPMLIHMLPDMIERISLEIAGGKLGPLPIPSHKSKEVPQSKGQDTLVTWLGMIRHRNLRDLFEVNNKRGTPLVESEVKNPELREWVILTGEDETEQLSITIDRWKYPRFREMVWDIELGHDLLLVRGVKKGWTSWRSIYVQDMWVIDPDDEEDELLEDMS